MAPRPTPEDLATRPIINRAPDTMADRHPRTAMVDAPARILQNSEVMQDWTPYGHKSAAPYFGGHDPLSKAGRGIMHTAYAGTVDKHANPFPNNGQFDRPNAFWAGLLRMQPHTSAHPGASMHAEAPGPPMLFHAPPIFGLQVQPIPAVGV